MARPKEDQIVAAISSVLPTSRIRELARDLGVVTRQRKVDVVCLVQALVLGFRIDRIRSMSGLRRAYQLMTGQTLARSSFHGRFTAPLVELMRRLTVDALEATAAKCNKLRDAFKPFIEVLTVDSSLVRLHAGLKEQYPSVWTNHMEASAKLTIVANVVGRGPKTLAINPGSRSDVHLLRPGKWLQGRLLIFDLGFYQAQLFKSIDDHGGYFLSRLRKQSNPKVIKSYRHGQRFLEGKKLSGQQDTVGQDIIDIEGEVTYRLKRDKVTHHTARFRVIAVYNPNLGCWHRYITNAPPQLPERVNEFETLGVIRLVKNWV